LGYIDRGWEILVEKYRRVGRRPSGFHFLRVFEGSFKGKGMGIEDVGFFPSWAPGEHMCLRGY